MATMPSLAITLITMFSFSYPIFEPIFTAFRAISVSHGTFGRNYEFTVPFEMFNKHSAHDLTGIRLKWKRDKKRERQNESSKEAKPRVKKQFHCKIKSFQIKRWYYLSNKFQERNGNDNLFWKLVCPFAFISAEIQSELHCRNSEWKVSHFFVWQRINIVAMQWILMCSINCETKPRTFAHWPFDSQW